MFTVLAILIACLGLFGLASYTVEQRTKEIGIRKVFGADDIIILQTYLKGFSYPGFNFGIVIALPVAYYFMSKWLENYVYRNHLGSSLFILAAALTILITFITVGFKAYQASIMNPAQSLKTQ